MRSSHKGSRSGAPGGPAPPGPGAILRRGGGNSSAPAPAPGPPLRVNGRAPPPSEALCVSARPAGSARDVPARAGGAPAPAPLAHANQSGSASGRAAPPGAPHVPCQEPLSFPLLLRGPEAAARALPAPRSPLPCQVLSSPLRLHLSPALLPGGLRPGEKVRATVGCGWPGSQDLDPACSHRTLRLTLASPSARCGLGPRVRLGGEQAPPPPGSRPGPFLLPSSHLPPRCSVPTRGPVGSHCRL